MFWLTPNYVSPLRGLQASAANAFASCCSVIVLLTATLRMPAQTTHVTSLSNGIRVQSAGQLIEITALREDVLRVRVWSNGQEPESASWAVLPTSLHSSVPVNKEAYGFRTDKLEVVVGSNLSLTVSDLSGHVLQEDAEPVVRHGNNFRVYKRSTAEDHFFGLGDKPGPLDRAGEAFTMWNTDHFAWQESTDPIYKSIPFFLQMRQGRTLGVFFNNTFRSYFDFGRENPTEYSFGSTDGPLDLSRCT